MDAALLSIAGALLGLLIGSVLAKKQDIERERRNKKAEAYANYIRISEKYNEMAMALDDSFYKVEVEYNQACGDLCIYATNDILNKISENHANDDKIQNYYNTIEGQQAYVTLIETMRKEISEDLEGVSYNTLAGVMGMQRIRSGSFGEEEK